MRAFRTTIAAALILALTLPLGSSGPPRNPGDQRGRVLAHAVDPAFLHGTDGRRIDRLAATVVTELGRYWTTAFPEHFGEPWRGLDGGYFSVDSTRTSDAAPPCSGTVEDVEGNAYYCPSVDAVAWDRAALLPVLRENYGEGAVAVVLAHELGHVVQQRTGREPTTERGEAMADCYAGSFLRWVADGHSRRLRFDPTARDAALRALTVFRDPTGSEMAGDAHGTALDRVSAFQDGFRSGPRRCQQVTDDGIEPGDSGERQRPLTDILHSAGLRSYFAELAHGRTLPRPRTGSDCVTRTARYCAGQPALAINPAGLRSLRYELGDHAVTTLLAARYALAAEDALGHPVQGVAARTRASCLSGAYTTSGADGPVSPGDLDAAVAVLLTTNRVWADTSDTPELTGFDRVSAFRTGARGGSAACQG